MEHETDAPPHSDIEHVSAILALRRISRERGPRGQTPLEIPTPTPRGRGHPRRRPRCLGIIESQNGWTKCVPGSAPRNVADLQRLETFAGRRRTQPPQHICFCETQYALSVVREFRHAGYT